MSIYSPTKVKQVNKPLNEKAVENSFSQRELELISSICKSGNKSGTKRMNISMSRTSEKVEARHQVLQEVVESQIRSEANSKKISHASYRIVTEKLERRLNQILNQVDQQGQGQVNFQQLGRFLTLLDIFSVISYNEENELEMESVSNPLQKQREMRLHEMAWSILSNGGEVIEVKRAFCMLRLAMDPTYQDATKCGVIMKEYLEKLDGGGSYDLELIQQFCREFSQLNAARLSNTKIGFLKPQLAQSLIEQYSRTLTFRPKLNAVSEGLQSCLDQNLSGQDRELLQSYMNVLASNQQQMEIDELLQKSMNPQNRVDELYRKQELHVKKVELMQQKKVEDELRECTFQPKTYSNSQGRADVIERLYQVKSRELIENQQREQQEMREWEEAQQCSFHPITNDLNQTNSILSQGLQQEVPGFDKTVQRMREAIDKQNLKKMMLNYVPKGEKYSYVQTLPFSPPEMLTRGKLTKQQPILYIDVNMAPGKTGRLAVRKGESVEKVVKSFAKIWGLGYDEIHSLIERVQTELEKYNPIHLLFVLGFDSYEHVRAMNFIFYIYYYSQQHLFIFSNFGNEYAQSFHFKSISINKSRIYCFLIIFIDIFNKFLLQIIFIFSTITLKIHQARVRMREFE